MRDGYRVQLVAVADPHDEAAVNFARKESHDRVIKDLGDRRASGVRWVHISHEEALETIDIVDRVGHTDEVPGGHGDYDGLRRFIEENPDSILIIAMAEEVRRG